MRRIPHATAAVALLVILFTASLPQVNNFFYPAFSEGITKIQEGESTLKTLDRTPEPSSGTTPSNEAPLNAHSTDKLTSRGSGGNAESQLELRTTAQGDLISPPTPTRQSTPNSTTAVLSATQTALPQKPTPTQAPPSAGKKAAKYIALQAGHWKYSEAPPPLNSMTGTSGGGKTEPEVTLAIANEVASILRSWGHNVIILPTVIPGGFKSDLFVSIHADGSTSPNPRGFFTDRPAGSPMAAAEARLSAAIDSEYARITGIPYVNRSTPNSRYYYGYRQVSASVPMVLIETGFLTSAVDREILVKLPQKAAEGIAYGIQKYLDQAGAG